MTSQQITDAISLITGTIGSVFTTSIFTTFPINIFVGASIAGLAIWLLSEIVDVFQRRRQQKD